MSVRTSRLREYLDGVGDALKSLDIDSVAEASMAIAEAYRRDSAVFIMGNGGSGSTASHAAYDFNIAVSGKLKKRFRFVSLCDNVTTLLALSNDYGYENVFYMQIKDVLKEGDIVFCISGSGNSENVVKVAEYARSVGCKVISFTGFDGGRLKKLSDHPVHVTLDDMKKAEDCHVVLLHAMARFISESLEKDATEYSV
jgi:D-sedoheptulose 7-phosphate isomerase